jgi:hypothetical protein
MVMRNFTVFTVPVLAVSIGACTQTAAPSAPVTAGPMDPNSVTTFTLVLQSGSITGCVMADPSTNRPVKLTVMNDKAELLTAGGIHYGLDRIGPGRYAGGYYIKIAADLAATPKRLTVSSNDGACNWAATSV